MCIDVPILAPLASTMRRACSEPDLAAKEETHKAHRHQRGRH